MSVYGGPRISEGSLVCHLDAATFKSYPGSGTTWIDLSGNGNNGTLTNGPTFSGLVGGSIVLDGVNDSVRIATNTQINSLSGDFTYEMIFTMPGTGSYIYPRGMAKGNYLGSGLTFGVNVDASVYGGGWAYGPTWTSMESGFASVPNNTWTHMIYTRFSNNVYSYYFTQNGLSYSTGAFSSDCSSANDLYLGANGSGGETGRLTIAVFRQYNRGLRDSEVYQNYYATRGRFNI